MFLYLYQESFCSVFLFCVDDVCSERQVCSVFAVFFFFFFFLHFNMQKIDKTASCISIKVQSRVYVHVQIHSVTIHI